MGKLFAGMLSAVVLLVGFGGSARAAEIPPTDECVATYKTSLKTYLADLDSAVSGKQEHAANRKWAFGLADAGCISDPEPLTKVVKPRPFSARCVAAVKAAGESWAPAARRVRRAERANDRRNRKVQKQQRRVKTQIRKLRQQGASRKRIRPLIKKSRRLGRQVFRSYQSLFKSLRRVVGPTRFSNSLTYLELTSLRCVDTFVFDESGSSQTPNSPYGRLNARDGLLIYSSLLFSFLDSERGSDAGTASASLPSGIEFGPISLAGPRS